MSEEVKQEELEKGLSVVEAIITPKVEEKQNVPVVSQGTNLAVSDPKFNPPSLFDVLQEDLVGFVRTTIDRTNAEKDLKELVSNTLTTRIKSDAAGEISVYPSFLMSRTYTLKKMDKISAAIFSSRGWTCQKKLSKKN